MHKLTGVTKLCQRGRRTVPTVRDLDPVISGGEWQAVQGRIGHGRSALLNLLVGEPTGNIARRTQRDGVMNKGSLTIHQAAGSATAPIARSSARPPSG